MSNVLLGVISIIAAQLGISSDKIDPDSKIIDDLGADSLDVIELLSLAEEEFGVKIPDEDGDKMVTVGDLVSYLEDKGRKSG